MKELINYMLLKKKELLKYRDKLRDIVNSQEENHQEELEKYKTKVEEIQEEIQKKKNVLKENLYKKIDVVTEISKLIRVTYPVEIRKARELLENKTNEIRTLRKNPKENYLAIGIEEENINNLKQRIESYEKSIKEKQTRLEEIIGQDVDEKDYINDLYRKIDIINSLTFKNIDDYEEKERIGLTNETILNGLNVVKDWCEKNFKYLPKPLRRLPRMSILDEENDFVRCSLDGKETEEQLEYRIGLKIKGFRQTKLFKDYINGKKTLKNMSEEEKKIFDLYGELLSEYDYIELNPFARNLLDIKKWCQRKFDDKPIYLRRTPSQHSKTKELTEDEKEEKRLGVALNNFAWTRIYEKYKELGEEKLNEAEKQLIDWYNEIILEYKIDPNRAKLLETKAWYEEKYNGVEKSKRILPRSKISHNGTYINSATIEEREKGLETEEQREIRLGRGIRSFSSSRTYDKYLKGESLSKEEKEVVDLYLDIVSGKFPEEDEIEK